MSRYPRRSQKAEGACTRIRTVRTPASPTPAWSREKGTKGQQETSFGKREFVGKHRTANTWGQEIMHRKYVNPERFGIQGKLRQALRTTQEFKRGGWFPLWSWTPGYSSRVQYLWLARTSICIRGYSDTPQRGHSSPDWTRKHSRADTRHISTKIVTTWTNACTLHLYRHTARHAQNNNASDAFLTAACVCIKKRLSGPRPSGVCETRTDRTAPEGHRTGRVFYQQRCPCLYATSLRT